MKFPDLAKPAKGESDSEFKARRLVSAARLNWLFASGVLLGLMPLFGDLVKRTWPWLHANLFYLYYGTIPNYGAIPIVWASIVAKLRVGDTSIEVQPSLLRYIEIGSFLV